MKLRLAVLGSLLALGACSKEIQVIEQCDGHVLDEDGGPSDTGGADAAVTDGQPSDLGPSDSGRSDLGLEDAGLADGGLEDGGLDGGLDDAGGGSCPSAYCIERLETSASIVDVREPVTITPVVTNPSGTVLSFSVDPNQIVTARGPMRPSLVLSEISYTFSVDEQTGETTFVVTDVPPWFFATSFTLRVSAKGPGATDPVSYAEVDVQVRGNVLFAASSIYAVASDGRKARNVNPNYTQGQLADDLVNGARGMVLSKDGTLLVYESSPSPDRISRWLVEGEDLLQDVFDTEDGNGQPLLSNSTTYNQLAELADGRVVSVDTTTGRTPNSRLVLWNADGSFDRVINSVAPSDSWSSVVPDGNGDFLVTIQSFSNARILRIDAQTGAVLETVADMLPDAAHSVLRLPNGDIYGAGEGYVVYLPGGVGVQNVTPLPFGTSTTWRSLAPFAEGRVMVSAAEYLSSGNIGIILGRTYERAARPPNVGGAYASPSGLVYLE